MAPLVWPAAASPFNTVSVAAAAAAVELAPSDARVVEVPRELDDEPASVSVSVMLVFSWKTPPRILGPREVEGFATDVDDSDVDVGAAVEEEAASEVVVGAGFSLEEVGGLALPPDDEPSRL